MAWSVLTVLWCCVSVSALTVPRNRGINLSRIPNTSIAPLPPGSSHAAHTAVAFNATYFRESSTKFNYTSNIIDDALYRNPVDLCLYGVIQCNYDVKDSDYQRNIQGTTHSLRFTVRANNLVSNKHTILIHQRLGKRRTVQPFAKDDWKLEVPEYPKPFEMYIRARRTFLEIMVMRWERADDMENSNIINTHNTDMVRDLNTEHPIEEHHYADFLNWLADDDSKVIESIKDSWKAPVDKDKVSTVIPSWGDTVVKESKTNPLTFNDLIMHASGSRLNPTPIVLANDEINSFKEHAWSLKEIISPQKYRDLVEQILGGERPLNELHSILRTAEGVYKYLNHPEISARLKVIYRDQIMLLEKFKVLTGKEIIGSDGKPFRLDEKYAEFTKQRSAEIQSKSREWFTDRINKDTLGKFDDKIKELEKAGKDPRKTSTNAKERTELQEKLDKLRIDFDALTETKKDKEANLDEIENEVSSKEGVKAKQDVRSKFKWGEKLKEYRDFVKDSWVVAGRKLYAQGLAIDMLSSEGILKFQEHLKEDRGKIERRLKALETMTMPEFASKYTNEEQQALGKIEESRKVFSKAYDGSGKRPLPETPSVKEPANKQLGVEGPDGAPKPVELSNSADNSAKSETLGNEGTEGQPKEPDSSLPVRPAAGAKGGVR